MKQVIALFALSTAVTVFMLETIFIDAFQIGLEKAASGNAGMIESIIALGILLICAVSFLTAMGR